MLKRISVNQLTVGMFLKSFCGSWLDHPFWRTAFVITDPQDIAAIRASRIREVWIDSAQGQDLQPGESHVATAEATGERPVAPAPSPKSARVPIAAEFSRAARIVANSRHAVSSMFEEARLGKAIDTSGAQRLVEDISESVSRNPGALISLARLKTVDDYTFMHSVAVCALMVALAKQLGLDEDETRSAGTAGLLHDLGKATIPIAVLNKPGKLTAAEFEIIKTHPAKGHEMLVQGGGANAVALDVVLHHHEQTDGSGYPDGLKDTEISLFAKMGAVCDVYDAVTSDRPYRVGWTPCESLTRMGEWTKGHLDPQVYQAFVKTVGIYPIGSLVMLNGLRLGVVVEQGEHSLLAPHVKVFFSTRSNARVRPEIVNLAHGKDKIIGREDPAKWNFPDFNEIWTGKTDLHR